MAHSLPTTACSASNPVGVARFDSAPGHEDNAKLQMRHERVGTAQRDKRTRHESRQPQAPVSELSARYRTMTKLTDETIARIMLLRACNRSFREIGEELNISQSSVTKYIYEFESRADKTSPEETVMDVLSPLAKLTVAGDTQHSEDSQ